MANIIAVEIAVMMAIIQRLENLFICGIDISLRGFGTVVPVDETIWPRIPLVTVVSDGERLK
ncbi:hypothetical protein [Corynebacterium diphtheriae]|uniref:hypothetical protein n=1 Tax=Corynebacterium diphtheriae TaxID=1717 RepID=UPI0008685AA6|nr:hypothetical protein [Corynebacterium diphtheriae]MBG9228436.1 hypothetical protein [Corynebacterium diphtheriae bv. gravis]MBG9248823.1 hypothetical protein [Corynebacterium diphtheriae bv. gravis]MBG9251172.1 hypothetical protein [Corynebacterium diphtheriae bv. mitis]MBG9255361.1 hypothetical protein [Corynebacterium diphtheriae bv. mitis]MBG9257214.1 hypothetical protein [Corynebacterium diphtheriae bv. mitis]